MQPNVININIQISGDRSGEAREVPVRIESPEPVEDAVIQNTTNAAQKALEQLHRSHYLAVVNTAKVSSKLLKKILLEAIPGLTVRVVNLGLKLLVLAGV
jgi:hypothetical protein